MLLNMTDAAYAGSRPSPACFEQVISNRPLHVNALDTSRWCLTLYILARFAWSRCTQLIWCGTVYSAFKQAESRLLP